MRLLVPAALVAATGIAFAVYLVIAERRRLQDAAQRYRELRDEGLDELRQPDTAPEFGASRGTMRLPDGRDVDRDALLRQELTELRRYEAEQAERRVSGSDREGRSRGTRHAGPR